MTIDANDESGNGGDAIAELQGYDKWPEDVSIAFDRALGVAKRKNRRTEFASSVADFHTIEAEFLVRIGGNQENAQQVRRIVTEMLLSMAWQKDQPFDVCQRYWNDLQQLGFYRIERQCFMTWFFADCCREHRQTDMGISVLEPLIAELERLHAEPTVAALAAECYEERLESMRRLRARLEAQKNGAG
jgi:hypothetical protein